ncbi:MAG: hypothetical protein QW774_02285 [Candidatus Micrarchaeaceae archaeon]
MANASIRYGVNIRKRQMSVISQKRMRYACDVCGKIAVRRVGTGIWKCRHCGTVFAGGAYTFKTPAGITASMMINKR